MIGPEIAGERSLAEVNSVGPMRDAQFGIMV